MLAIRWARIPSKVRRQYVRGDQERMQSGGQEGKLVEWAGNERYHNALRR